MIGFILTTIATILTAIACFSTRNSTQFFNVFDADNSLQYIQFPYGSTRDLEEKSQDDKTL